MKEDQYFRFSNAVLLAPMVAVLAIWTVYLIEVRYQINLNHLGILPRTLSGLKGIVFSPFLHGSLKHLYNNTLPLLILTAALVYFYREVAWKVLLWGGLATGLATWLIGAKAYHIGASGIIYLLASFIFFMGVRTRHFRLIALSMMVVFIYGGMLWYIFPIKEGISWEGHLSGFLTGLVMALIYKPILPEKKKYAWEESHYNEEEDEFLQQFDEEGNFIGDKLPDEQEEPRLKITYHYKRDRDRSG